ncbi:unnamed protein product, partial [Amoebophrya sp. A120]|eukprot:GSA120T00024170001.1
MFTLIPSATGRRVLERTAAQVGKDGEASRCEPRPLRERPCGEGALRRGAY